MQEQKRLLMSTSWLSDETPSKNEMLRVCMTQKNFEDFWNKLEIYGRQIGLLNDVMIYIFKRMPKKVLTRYHTELVKSSDEFSGWNIINYKL
jgi:hypothetical protein